VAVAPHLHGFDEFRAGALANLNSPGGGYDNWSRIDDGGTRYTSEYATAAVRDETIRWWRATAGRKFAVVAFHAAHAPYHTPPPDLLPPHWPPPRNNRQRFEAMIASVDIAIGQILAAIDLERTYVFFLSDNGTAQGVASSGGSGPGGVFNDPPEDVKHTTFDGGIRVPLIVAGPGVARDKVSDALVSAVDFVATLRDVLRAAPYGAGAEDSVSFAASLSEPGRAGARAFVFSEAYGADNDGLDDQAVVTKRYKLRIADGVLQLYDLVADPAEDQPLSFLDPTNAAIRDAHLRILAEQVPPRRE
jgi:arylsulfatase A-like enzyme